MGFRNPDWQRDELILALDLYFKHAPSVPGPEHSEIVALSRLLKDLPIHPARPDPERFRNPASVRSKLYNLAAFDPGRVRGKGRDHGSGLDEEVFREFDGRRDELHRLAVAIRAGHRTAEAMQSRGADDEEEAFPEGRVLFRIHRARERNATLAKRAKERALRKDGTLRCIVCEFNFAASYGSIGQGYIECHHTHALSDVADETATRLDEVALVCSNCHRMIHRRRPWLKLSELRTVLAPRR